MIVVMVSFCINMIPQQKFNEMQGWLLLTFPLCLYNILKVHLCKLCNKKYMITSAQITNIEIFAFITVLVFELLSRICLLINKKRQ